MAKMSKTFSGTLCGIIAAICYGTNPLGALFLYRDGVNTNTVLTCRFGLAAVIIAVIMTVRRESFRIKRKELLVLAILGLLFAASSMSLYYSFKFIDAGVASTLLFVYPIMVAVIMSIFFKEKISIVTVLSIALAFSGIMMLYNTGAGVTLNATGVLLVMISSLTYALYIIIVNRSQIAMSPFKMTFYVLLFCIAGIVLHSFLSPDTHIHALPTPRSWLFALMLAIVPTFLSLVLMTISIRNIGSTPSAIMGALEPLTAVFIGITVFGEPLTLRLVCGILLILSGVLLIIAGKTITLHSHLVWQHIKQKMTKHPHPGKGH